MTKQVITSSPDVMGGTPVFAGTRVPVQTLIDYLKGGESIDDFLDDCLSGAQSNRLADLKPLAPKILSLLPTLPKGKAETVSL